MYSQDQIFFLNRESAGVTLAPIESVALWAVCRFNVARLLSFFKSVQISRQAAEN